MVERKDEILQLVTMWMEKKGMVLSEMSQKERINTK